MSSDGGNVRDLHHSERDFEPMLLASATHDALRRDAEAAGADFERAVRGVAIDE